MRQRKLRFRPLDSVPSTPAIESALGELTAQVRQLRAMLRIRRAIDRAARPSRRRPSTTAAPRREASRG